MYNNLIVKKVEAKYIEDNLREDILKLNENNNGTVFHEVQINILISRNLNTELNYYLAFNNNELVGFCPCHSIRNKLVKNIFSNLSSYEVPYGGWIFDSNKISYSKLMKLTSIPLNSSLYITSSIDLTGNVTEDKGINFTKKHNTPIIDFRKWKSEDIFNEMPSKQRNKIRRSYKVGVECEYLTPKEFDEFWVLSSELKEKIGLAQKTKDFYKDIFTYLYKENRAICISARYQGEIISSMILVANTNFTIAWVAGRKYDLPNNLYQNEMLWWETIKWSETKSKALDLCGLDEEKLPHLARIKLSFTDDVRHFYSFSKKSIIFRLLSRINKLLIS